MLLRIAFVKFLALEFYGIIKFVDCKMFWVELCIYVGTKKLV